MLATTSEGKGSGRVTPTLREHETRRDENETETKTKKDLNETAHLSRNPSCQEFEAQKLSEVLRKARMPKASTVNSSVARAARGQK